MAAFVVIAEALCFWSRKQDAVDREDDAARLRRRMVRWSVGGLVLLAPVLTLASWDWIMSLEPAWYSDLYGVYLFAGALVSALGLLGILAVASRRSRSLAEQISSQHFYAIGRLQLALLIFWAYIAWCHVITQWLANVPAEQVFLLKRWRHGWQWEGAVVMVGHFVLPFFALLPRWTKKRPEAFFAVSVYLVVVHAVDVHYLIVPALYDEIGVPHWLDFAAVVAVVGLTVLFATVRGRKLPPLPTKDPLLRRGLAYESRS
jgi:hypothetical protein